MKRLGGNHPDKGLLWLPLSSIAVLTILSLIVFLLTNHYWMKDFFERVENQHRQSLIQIVSIARNAIEPVMADVRAGQISREEAVNQIRARVRAMTYLDPYGNNYIFMSAYDGTMLVQPFEPKMELTDQWNLQDAHGLYIIRELVQAAKTHPEGSFVRYHYHLPGVHSVQEKMAYVVGLPELECYIGSGMYMQHAMQEQKDILQKIKNGSIWLLLAVLLPICVSIAFILSRNRRLGAEISMRKDVENSLKASEAKYRSIFENAVEGVFQSTREGRFVSVNPALARMAGYESPQDMMENIVSIERQYYDEPSDRLAFLKTLEKRGSIQGYVMPLKRKDGSRVWASISARVVRDEAGAVLYYEGTIEDITERKRAEEDVKRLASIVWHSGELVMLAEPDGRLVFLNEAGSKMLGIDRGDIGKTNLLQVIPAPFQDWLEKDAMPILQAGGSWEGDLQCLNLKTGETTDVHTLAFFIEDPDSSRRKYLATLSLDISQRKQTERVLRESEARLRGITGNMPGVVFQFYARTSGEYGMNYVSERVELFLGLTEKLDALFPAFISHIHDDDREPCLASIRKSVETAAPWNYEGRFVKPSGELIWIHGLATPTRRDEGLVFDGILLNITERKQAEEMSRQAEEKFTKIFMTTPDGIAITRMADGCILDLNAGFEAMLGWKRSEVVGRTSLDVHFWDNPSDREAMLADLKDGRDILYREVYFRRRDGSRRAGIYSARSIRIADEGCIIFVLQDITGRLALEEERRKLERQLYQSQKLDAIGQLAGGVAHDFNNILMGIQGNVSLMLAECPGSSDGERLRRIEEHVKRGAGLTKQLLGFAREGKYEVKVLSVNELIQKSAQFFLETRKEIEATMDLQEDLRPVEADAGQIEQALLNLFINAGHAMPKGGRVHLQTSNISLQESDAKALETKPGEYVRISVSDTGVGMDKETLKRIFEPFFTTRSDQGGSGLGLASAYGIVRNHGGAINAYSEPGKGATFNIYLPASAKTIERETPAPADVLRSGSGGVLLVDDEPMILNTASHMLAKLGYTVFQAASGKEALALYRDKQSAIDLVILDMIMPGITGSQMLKLLKEMNPEVRIILSSGYSLQGDVQALMEMGCRGFIQKPYNFVELSNIVHQNL